MYILLFAGDIHHYEFDRKINFNYLAKIIMEEECIQKFTFDWFYSIEGDQELKIFPNEPNWKLLMVADFLKIQDFSRYYKIMLKHKCAASETESKSLRSRNYN